MNHAEKLAGWASSKLAEIISPQSSICYGVLMPGEFTPNGIPLIRVKDINKNIVNDEQIFLISHELDSEFQRSKVTAGTILVSIQGTVGCVAITPEHLENANISRTIAKLELAEPGMSRWIWASLLSPQGQEKMLEETGGSTRASLNISALREIELPIPPLAEQTRIAQKLDELLVQVDTLKARIDAIPDLLKRFRQSVLAAAVSGRLTEEWRKENPICSQWTEKTIRASVETERSARGFKPAKVNETQCVDRIEAPSNWVWLKFSEVSLKITDGAHNTPKITDEGFPYITAKDLTGGALDFSEGKFISESDHRELYKKCAPSIGDLLVVNIGAGTGNSVLVDVDFEFSFKNVAIIKRPQVINPQYLKAFFEARKKAIFNEQTQGGAQPFLSLTMLGNIEIVLPPPKEQTEIVRRVEQLFAFAEQLEAKVASAKSRIDHLTQSILAKAFRGELVPQDSNDEPASVLLERIQAQRAAAPKAKRGRKASA